jgi:hypothetical protein
MNSLLHRHGLTGQQGDPTDTAPGGDINNLFDPLDITAPAPEAVETAATFGAASPAVSVSGAEQTASTPSAAGPIVTSAARTGLVIDVTYDSSVTDLDTVGNAAYDPTLYNDYVSAAQAAVQFYEDTFTNPVTLNINFGWGEVGGSTIAAGDLAESSRYTQTYNYAQVLKAVKATDTTSAVQSAALATLPATDPTGGGKFSISTAESKVLGLFPAYTGSDGSVGLDSSAAFSWSQTDIASGTFDAVGALEHEISEVMGRADFAGVNNTYTLLDMFRYTAANGQSGDAPGSAAGVRDEPFVAGYSTTAPASAAAGLNSYSYFSYNGTTITNQYDIPSEVAAGADVADWASTVSGDSYGYSDSGQASLVTTTDLQEMNVLGYDLVACYLPDTRIATPSGEVPVQNLVVGGLVSTYRGEARPIVWIGHGKALATRGRRGPATPVIVRKGALADNMPNRDLRITKGHALYLDNVLIPVEFLVNHRSVVWDDRAQEVTVFHIELGEHDVLLANGVPAESFRDDGNRWLFQNNGTAPRRPAPPPCAPVLTGGPVVDAVWKRVLDRSGTRPGLPLTDDPDVHLLVDGRRVKGVRQSDDVYGFRMPRRPDAVRLVSRAGAPDELGLARDPRVLGVAVRRIIIWRGRFATVIEAADPRLHDGFHAFEADAGYRWTDGDAVLPASLFGGGVNGVDLYAVPMARYPLLTDAVVAAA